MSQIRVLPPEVAHKIAAGEVIERPASVVKELVENAIDAQATQISVEIRGGGLEFIRIQDNGAGIAQDELELAFQPHATSKITSAEDLFSLYTLGFRGEALPSIASISKLVMYSRPAQQNHGYKITPNKDRDRIEPVGAPAGTTVEVEDLFYNVPARLKFLKSQSTERRHVLEIATKLALAHPHISFRILAEGKLVLATPGNGNLLDTILVVEGSNISSDLLKFQASFVWGEIQGYLGTPRLGKGNRSGQIFILNGRVIQNLTLRSALEKAYAGLLPNRTYPWAILTLDLNPELVDCNVHPAKAEVRFAQDQAMFSDVLQAVRSGLSGKNLAPSFLAPPAKGELSTSKSTAVQVQLEWQPETWEHMDQVLRQYRPAARNHANEPKEPINEQLSSIEQSPKLSFSVQEERPSFREHKVSDGIGDVRELLVSGRILGQLQQTYILLEVPQGLWIIDQHIVHERILFEQLEEAWESASIHVQEIFPQRLDFTPSEAQLISDSLEHLKQFGLDLEEFGSNSFILRAVPSSLAQSGGNWKEEVLQIAETSKKTTGWKEESLITLACKGAVKAGDYLDETMIRALLKGLAQTQNPFTCPHGRPIIVRLENQELMRRFGRT